MSYSIKVSSVIIIVRLSGAISKQELALVINEILAIDKKHGKTLDRFMDIPGNVVFDITFEEFFLLAEELNELRMFNEYKFVAHVPIGLPFAMFRALQIGKIIKGMDLFIVKDLEKAPAILGISTDDMIN